MATKGTHTVLKEIHLIATAKNHLVIDVLEPPGIMLLVCPSFANYVKNWPAAVQ